MKNVMKAINAKLITAQIRISDALHNDDGMEVVQFLAVALLSITIGAALVTGLKDSLSTTIASAASKLSTVFDFS